MGKKSKSKKSNTFSSTASAAEAVIPLSSTALLLQQLPQLTSGQQDLYKKFLNCLVSQRIKSRLSAFTVEFAKQAGSENITTVLNFKNPDSLTFPMRVCDQYLKNWDSEWLKILEIMVKDYNANIFLEDNHHCHALARICHQVFGAGAHFVNFTDEVGRLIDTLHDLGMYFVAHHLKVEDDEVIAEARYDDENGGILYVQDFSRAGGKAIGLVGKVVDEGRRIDYSLVYKLPDLLDPRAIIFPSEETRVLVPVTKPSIKINGQELEVLLKEYDPAIIQEEKNVIIQLTLNPQAKVNFEKSIKGVSQSLNSPVGFRVIDDQSQKCRYEIRLLGWSDMPERFQNMFLSSIQQFITAQAQDAIQAKNDAEIDQEFANLTVSELLKAFKQEDEKPVDQKQAVRSCQL